ncbi:hypothetical protein [Luteibacter sp. 3190]|uniref:hypothetical protein n=1 Tax=Luteibacter sp. 3190 TaxID=2817736 RepID=UPI00285F9E0A|nr:hypothetical protein [Luteibacter sp. 3190]MDR6935319.1 hypothetical protein [Luteibacter sp. 3190]
MDIEKRLEILERRSRLLAVAAGVLCIVLAAVVVSAFTALRNPTGILRAKGLVIEDTQGRPRILLGAPFPEVVERERTDARSTAMLFLDDHGHDRLTVGEGLPAKLQGKVAAVDQRIGASFGVIIHDLEGNERGGLSFLSNGRATMALDYPGRDAIGLSVDDRLNRAEFMLNYSPKLTGPGSSFEIYQQDEVTTFSINNREGDPALVRTFRFGVEQRQPATETR